MLKNMKFESRYHIPIILLILSVILFTITTTKTSNQLSKQSDTIDSLRMELNACDMENNLFGTVLNQIKESDSDVLIKALETLEKNQ